MRILAGHLKLFVICLFLACLSSTALAATVDLRQTGQTTSYAAGDDGDFLAGAEWPNPRFADNGDNTITDKLTGLMWTKNANLPGGARTWQQALDYVAGLNAGAGLCGFHDWRLPNRVELSSLLDYSHWNKSILTPNPFTNIIPGEYWTSTSASYQYGPDAAWDVRLDTGVVYTSVKHLANAYLWPVRTGIANPEYETFLSLIIR